MIVLLALVLGAGGALLASCDGGGGATTSSVPTSEVAGGEPFRIGVSLDFTGSTATDAAMADHGIRTALEQVGYQVLGRPIELITVDSGSDPVVAVSGASQLVKSDKVDVILGPASSSSYAAVTEYLAKTSGTPCISVCSMPTENLLVAHDLAVIAAGVDSVRGYYLGKYASEILRCGTANIIASEDTASRSVTTGFVKAFATEGGGQVLSTQYVPNDVLDFSQYLATLQPADVTADVTADVMVSSISGDGAGPFVSQYHALSLTAPLVMAMAEDLPEPLLLGLGDAALDIVASGHYLPLIDNASNTRFVADYTAQWNGEQPSMNSFGGWLAVNVFLEAVKKTNGDTKPAALIEAMSTLSLETPAGIYTLAPYEDAIIGTGDFYIFRSAQIGQDVTWRLAYTYKQVLFEAKD